MPDGAEKSDDLMVAGGTTGGETAALLAAGQGLSAAPTAGIDTAGMTAHGDGMAGRPHRGPHSALKAGPTQVVHGGGRLSSAHEIKMRRDVLRKRHLTLT
ncbi:hypothetical protein ACIGXF_36250 [Streptomyces sp. NPDC053086]|uniref:hypothetical protein n=1 Tax=unclassified Streptomyces TaxID=2593676 RepID=UPI0037D09BBE